MRECRIVYGGLGDFVQFNSQHSHSHSHSYSYSYHHHHEDTNAIILALKQELLLLRADVAVGKQETLTLRAEVASLQTDVNTLKTRVHKLENPGEGLELQEPTVEIELTPMNHSYSQGNIPLSPVRKSYCSHSSFI